MTRRKRLILVAAGVVLLVLGLACLNYMRPGNREDHSVWAEAHNMPPPSRTIFVGGVASAVAGIGLAAFALVKKR